MLKHKTKFTALLLAAGTCFSGTICTFAESTSSADAANATEVFSTPLYTSGLYSTDEQPEGVTVTHDMQSALRYADRILHAGHRQWFWGTAAEYLASPWGKRFGGDGV